MWRIGTTAVLAAAAFALGGAAVASAAKTLELSTSEVALIPGALIDLGGINRFETPEGVVECPNGLFSASLLNNNGAKDKISIDAGLSTGKNGVACSTTTALGSVEVKAAGVPWTQQLAASGKALLKGREKLQLSVSVPSLGGLSCGYETPRIDETFALGANGTATPLILAVPSEQFVRSFGSSIVCPALLTTNAAEVPVSVEGASAELLPVFVTRHVVAKK
jgi:hypothetical protein